jgi:hypothetical protein
MYMRHKINPLLIALSLCCAAPLLQPLSATEAELAAAPVAWHTDECGDD